MPLPLRGCPTSALGVARAPCGGASAPAATVVAPRCERGAVWPLECPTHQHRRRPQRRRVVGRGGTPVPRLLISFPLLPPLPLFRTPGVLSRAKLWLPSSPLPSLVWLCFARLASLRTPRVCGCHTEQEMVTIACFTVGRPLGGARGAGWGKAGARNLPCPAATPNADVACGPAAPLFPPTARLSPHAGHLPPSTTLPMSYMISRSRRPPPPRRRVPSTPAPGSQARGSLSPPSPTCRAPVGPATPRARARAAPGRLTRTIGMGMRLWRILVRSQPSAGWWLMASRPRAVCGGGGGLGVGGGGGGGPPPVGVAAPVESGTGPPSGTPSLCARWRWQ